MLINLHAPVFHLHQLPTNSSDPFIPVIHLHKWYIPIVIH